MRLSLDGNILAAIDYETTGTLAGYHEPVQVAIVLLDEDLQPGDYFYSLIRPLHLDRIDDEAMRIHKIPLDELLTAALPCDVAERFYEWFVRHRLTVNKRFVPLAHEWPFECSFTTHWLGQSMMREVFHPHARDAKVKALALNDRSMACGGPQLFPRVGLNALCKQFGIVNSRPHDALSDSLAEIAVYRELVAKPL